MARVIKVIRWEDDYLNGVFTGIEWQLVDWLQLVADYDGTGINSGIKLFLPEGFLPWEMKLSSNIQFFSSSDTPNRDNMTLGLQVTMPMWQSKSSMKRRVEEVSLKNNISEQEVHSKSPTLVLNRSENIKESNLYLKNNRNKSPEVKPALLKQQISNTFIHKGFENIQITQVADILYLSFENNIYNQNEVEALSVAFSLISSRYDGRFKVFLLNNKLPVLLAEGKSEHWHNYIGGKSISPNINFVTNGVKAAYSSVLWSGEVAASGSWLPRVNFSPNLRSTIGTEWGVFDYSLALGTNLTIDLWQGAVFDIRHLLPVLASDDAGKYKRPVEKHRNEIDRILIHQAFQLPFNLFSQFSGGLLYSKYRGVLNETQWQSSSGKHKVSFKVGEFTHRDTKFKASPKLAYYRLQMPSLNWNIELHTGEYFRGDRGFGISSKHWFDNFSLSVNYNNTDEEFAGLSLSFPLGMSKSMKPKYVQITGTDEWSFNQKTRISGNANYLSPNSVWQPSLQHDISRGYMNRDRLSREYIESKLYMLK